MMSERMKEAENPRIVIRPVENRAGEHLAYYNSEFLKATFSVYFQDDIFGALALNSFSEMIRKQFGKQYRREEVEFVIEDESMQFKSKALLDVLVDNAFGKREKVAV